MASKFRIISYKFEDSLCLKLTGDFDGGSAQELTNTLKKLDKCSGYIFVDTNNLKTIHPFDKDEFQKILKDIKKRLKNLFIIGTNKDQIGAN